MSIDYLIHKNTYVKNHSGLTYALMRSSTSYQITNCHNRLYDLYFALKPKTIVFQIEEYSNELHAFATDSSMKDILPDIVVTVDDNEAAAEKYVSILKQITAANITLFIPRKLADHIVSLGMNFKTIVYDNIYNKDVFFPMNLQRNDKILCILSTDKTCVSKIESLLYPNTSLPISMVNNPEVDHNQNIGLMFDSDINLALNTYGSVIDLSNSYRSEIAICGIDSYDISKLPDLVKDESPKVQPVEIGEFIAEHMIHTLNNLSKSTNE